MRPLKDFGMRCKMSATKNQILIGHNICSEILSFLNSTNPTQVIIFTQEKVQMTAGSLLKEVIKETDAKLILLEDGEDSKDIKSAVNSVAQLAQISADRETLLIAYGGGSVSDHVGFVASIFKRGVRYINIPTTLIGMIDASIGGKTALNMDSIKNQIGTFYQPSKIFIDLSIIKTMSTQIIQDGLGEMFKYAILSKENLLHSFEEYLDNNNEKLLNEMIRACCKLKSEIVQIDEKDQNLRKTLNLGHTFGHAIESESNNNISHGIAVINGILMASFLSFRKGYLKKEKFYKIEQIGTLLLSNRYKIKDVDKYVDIMLKDKKNQNQKIGIIVIKNIGNVSLHYFTFNEIYEVAEEYNEHISN